ncbi:MAG: Rieske (2Fe-2S) protein [Alcanivorax sp.]|nr:Rieske (2Fe-2S) protein [Alcanivorax sp.]
MRYSVGASSDLGVGESRAVKAGDTKLVVYHLSDGFYATQARCSHMFAPLGRGKVLNDKCVQCPLHRARFDIRTGEVQDWANFPPGIQVLNGVRGEKKLQTWPVIEEDGQLYVEI